MTQRPIAAHPNNQNAIGRSRCQRLLPVLNALQIIEPIFQRRIDQRLVIPGLVKGEGFDGVNEGFEVAFTAEDVGDVIGSSIGRSVLRLEVFVEQPVGGVADDVEGEHARMR